MDNRVTVVLNGYRRSEYAKEQYEAYRNQSVGTPQFLFWGNLPEDAKDLPFDSYVVDGSKSSICNSNMGVWARFAYALNASTPFICIADDDAIPGKRWLENCIDTTYEINQSCVLTTKGITLKSPNYPNPESYIADGFVNPNEETKQVDFGGNCWFFSKTLLKAFWVQAPDVLPLNYGEDINLSFASWMVAASNTYVPKHPADNKELWGSLEDLGQDLNATIRSQDASIGMNQYINHILQVGYKPVLARNENGTVQV